MPSKCPQCGTELPSNATPDQCPKCLLRVGLGSQPAAPQQVPPTPAELAKYFPQLEILGVLGQGGMGVVYKARHKRLDRLVALKILPADSVRESAFAERFTREARALARLNHPHIVAVYDFGETEGIYYLLMEYVDGVNLRQLEQSGALTPQEALRIVPTLCEALQYAHNLGVVHRDIKPENVLVDKQGQPKIADFGLAKLLGPASPESSLTHDQQIMGTMNYMAPEQHERPTEVDHRADIYSLGVVFYEMLTGELPIGRFAPPSQKVAVDVRLDEVVLRALEKERERRYQQVSEVKTDLEKLSTSAPTSSAPAIAAGPWAQARAAVRGPAIGLIVVGVLNWLFAPLVMWVGLYFATHEEGGLTLAPLVISLTVLVVAATFILFAGLKMKSLEARWAGFVGSILAMLITPVNLIGLPVGIWALVTLSRKSVQQAFGQEGPAASPAFDQETPRNWFAITATALLAMIGLACLLILAGLTVGLLLPAVQRVQAQRAQAQEAQAHAIAGDHHKALLSGIRNELQARYTLHTSRMPMADSHTSGVFIFTGTSFETKEVQHGELHLRLLTNGIWQVKGRAPLEHIQFVVPTAINSSSP